MATKPTTKTNVFEELVKVTKVTQKKGEAQTAYLERLIEGASKLTDDAFDKLSAATQDYFNKAAEAINEGKDIPVPAGMTAPAAEEAPKAAAKVQIKPAAKEAAKPATKAPAKPAAKEAAKPEAKEAKPAAPAKGDKKYPGLEEFTRQRTSGVGFKIRMAVVKKPNIAFEAAAKAAGVEAVVGSHAWNEWNYTKAVMELVAYNEAQSAAAE